MGQLLGTDMRSWAIASLGTGTNRVSRPGRRLRAAAFVLLPFLSSACADRRDIADLAVGVAPFEQLRGMDVVQLRSGAVRALRANAAPAPLEGLRETVGDFDVLYALQGFDGLDGSWPSEDALVLSVEAVQEWQTDAIAETAWKRAVQALESGFGVAPQCAMFDGPGFAMRVAEWDQGDGWSVSASYAASMRVVADTTVSARHSVAVRRQALTAQYPQAGQPNDDDRPTWTRTTCTAPAPVETATTKAP